jgi:hypothetical protein
MTLFKTLQLPFQTASLLFVGIIALLLALVTSLGAASMLMSLFLIWVLLVWVTRYAFTMIDDAANGTAEAQVASVDMLSPMGDPRCWVHPTLVAVVSLVLTFHPEMPRWPAVSAAALLFPASIGAITMSGRALDAFNPAALWQVIHGLGAWYLLALAGIAVAAAAGAGIMQLPLWSVLRFAALLLLLLACYAWLGGLLHLRRIELNFEPRHSPEKIAIREIGERDKTRQQMIDALFKALRAHEPQRAVSIAGQWLANAGDQHIHADAATMVEAASKWSEHKGFLRLLSGLIPILLDLKQTALALKTVESGLQNHAAFAPAAEEHALLLARYARQTGRKRLASQIANNYLGSHADSTCAELRNLANLNG